MSACLNLTLLHYLKLLKETPRFMYKAGFKRLRAAKRRGFGAQKSLQGSHRSTWTEKPAAAAVASHGRSMYGRYNLPPNLNKKNDLPFKRHQPHEGKYIKNIYRYIYI